MNIVCEFLSFKMVGPVWVLWETNSETETSTEEIYQECPWKEAGFSRGRSPAVMEPQGKQATVTLQAVLR